MQTTLNSFKYAIQGLKDALKSEPNLRFHFLASLIVLLFASFLKFSSLEFIVLVLTIGFVIVLELINTIIEKLVNMNSTAISEEARIIKDMSASVVLIGSMAAVIVGLFLFGNKL